jgi:2-phosphosulfolactate phosphatase
MACSFRTVTPAARDRTTTPHHHCRIVPHVRFGRVVDSPVVTAADATGATAATEARFLGTHELDGATGPVVVVDVIRAFTTAAHAIGAGARAVYLVDSVDEALAFKVAHPGSVAMGEDRGYRPEGFDLPNSPAMASRADLRGRLVVQRTSAGTRGVVAAAPTATRLWAAALVTASATARAVQAAGGGAPTYVITGNFADRADRPGNDDLATARFIEAVRTGGPASVADAAAVAASVRDSDEAMRTLLLGPEHVDPDDIAFATQVDRFDFALEVTRDPLGLRLDPVRPRP